MLNKPSQAPQQLPTTKVVVREYLLQGSWVKPGECILVFFICDCILSSWTCEGGVSEKP